MRKWCSEALEELLCYQISLCSEDLLGFPRYHSAKQTLLRRLSVYFSQDAASILSIQPSKAKFTLAPFGYRWRLIIPSWYLSVEEGSVDCSTKRG